MSTKGVLDSNCYLGDWPTRRIGVRTPADLLQIMSENGIGQCLVSSLDAVFHRDHVSANRRLIDQIAASGSLHPLEVHNPLSPIPQDLGPAAVRIVPVHHRYSPASRECRRLLSACEREGVVVLVSMRMRDERLVDPGLRTRPTGVGEMAKSLAGISVPVIVNNAKSFEIQALLTEAKDNILLSLDWSLPIRFIERMIDEFGDRRLVYGSNAPLHYVQSSLLQVRMAGIRSASKERILSGNLRRAMPDVFS